MTCIILPYPSELHRVVAAFIKRGCRIVSRVPRVGEWSTLWKPLVGGAWKCCHHRWPRLLVGSYPQYTSNKPRDLMGSQVAYDDFDEWYHKQ